MAFSDGNSRFLFAKDAVHGLSRIHLIHMPSWSSAFPGGRSVDDYGQENAKKTIKESTTFDVRC